MKNIQRILKKVTQFPVVVHPDENGGYWVECLTFEGCYSQGETIEEALDNIQEAIELCLEEYPVKDIERRVAQPVSFHLVTV